MGLVVFTSPALLRSDITHKSPNYEGATGDHAPLGEIRSIRAHAADVNTRDVARRGGLRPLIVTVARSQTIAG